MERHRPVRHRRTGAVCRHPADEHRPQPEPPERASRVERPAAEMRRRPAAGLEHEVDDRLGGDGNRAPGLRDRGAESPRRRGRARDVDGLLFSSCDHFAATVDLGCSLAPYLT